MMLPRRFVAAILAALAAIMISSEQKPMPLAASGYFSRDKIVVHNADGWGAVQEGDGSMTAVNILYPALREKAISFSALPEEIIRAHHVTRTVIASGKPITITGSNNEIVVQGKCPRLTVGGVHNRVIVLQTNAIVCFGNKNEVTWKATSSQPFIILYGALGSINTVLRE